MSFTKSGVVEVKSLRSENVRVRVYGDTAVVNGMWVSVDRRAGQEFAERKIRYLIVYVRREGRWQIVAEQRTGVAAQNQNSNSLKSSCKSQDQLQKEIEFSTSWERRFTPPAVLRACIRILFKSGQRG